MSELSPQAEARDVELATTKGRPHVAARGRTVRARPWLPPCGGAVERSETEGGIRRLSCSDRRGVSPFRPSVRTGAPPPQGRRPFVGRDDPGAPNFPLQGKVAFAEQMTDEGATCPVSGRRNPPGPSATPLSQGGLLWGPRRSPAATAAGSVGRVGAAEWGSFRRRRKRTIWSLRRRRGGPMCPPESTPQARALNKEMQQGQISYHERQRAGKIPFFKLAPTRRMENAGKGQRFPKGNF